MPRLLGQKGIVLVTTLLTVVLVVMMVTTVVHSGTAGLALTTNFHDREAALLAAESGLQYAATRLQNEVGWRGDNPDTPTTKPDQLVIAESNGNVVGIITSKLGQKSVFRIKFNFEDGDAGDDGLPDPAPEYSIPSPFVSYNNILGDAAIPAYRANKNGKYKSSEDAKYNVPVGTACVIVEGLAGPGVRDATPGQPISDFGRVVTRCVEGYFQVDSQTALDSVAYAAGNIKANLAKGGSFRVKTTEEDGAPHMRSMKDIQVNAVNGKFVAKNGKVYYGTDAEDSTHHCTFNGDTAKLSSERQDSSKNFTKLTWDDVVKATPQDTNLRSGTYAWGKDEKGNTVLKYFSTVYPLGEEIPASAKGEIVNTDSIAAGTGAITVDPSTLGVLINQNVYVSGDAGIVFRTCPELDGSRATVGFVPAADGTEVSVLTSEGMIQVQGGIMGSGSITTEGSVTFQGPSVLESDPDTGVSIYAQGDVNLEAITSEEASNASGTTTTSSKSGTVSYTPTNEHHILAYPNPWPDGPSTPRPTATTTPTPTPQPSTPVTDPTPTPSADPTDPDDTDDPGESGDGLVVDSTNVDSVTTFEDERLIKEKETYQQRKMQQLKELVAQHSKIAYSDQDISGVIYTWGNFNVNIGERSLLNVSGTIVAYGGDPSVESPGARDTGNIAITKAKSVTFTYDPAYIKQLLSQKASIKLRRTLWTSW